ncbi:uncharacterized protein LOC141929345 [Strix aluco]|uniref:uncharacterized protein LOC141929345 n=1 Tax=Strix aluco TaxID=111821 RepID=UPI003DA5C2B1
MLSRSTGPVEEVFGTTNLCWFVPDLRLSLRMRQHSLPPLPKASQLCASVSPWLALMVCCYMMLMGLRAGSHAHGSTDMLSERNSGAPGCSPRGLTLRSLHGRAQPTVPLCPPLTHRGQWSVEAPAGAAAWRHPGCPGHLPLPASKVRWPGWRALARRLLRPARQGGSTLGRPRAPRGMCFGGTVAGHGFPQCCPVAAGWAGGQRWHVLTQACTMWGGTGWVPGRWGQAPDAALLSLCTPHVGPGAWFGAELPCGAHPPSYLKGPGALSAGRMGSCYLRPGAIESPGQMVTQLNLGGETSPELGTLRGDALSLGKGPASDRKVAGWGHEGCCAGALFLRLGCPAPALQWQGLHLQLAADGSSGFFRC